MNACGCVYSTQYLNTFLFTLDLIVLVCLSKNEQNGKYQVVVQLSLSWGFIG